MTQFTSSREKRLWLWTSLVIVTIFLSLFIGQPLARQLRDQNIQAVFFLLGMMLVGTTILVQGIRVKPGKVEITILIGIIAVYVMFFFRLGAPERSHLIKYSVLAIFMYSALIERAGPGNQKLKHALLAFAATFLIGVLDECIQIILPNRVFDPQDILFNGMVAAMAIGSSLVLTWIHTRITKSKLKEKQKNG